jgi:hypothetical protein
MIKVLGMRVSQAGRCEVACEESGDEERMLKGVGSRLDSILARESSFRS